MQGMAGAQVTATGTHRGTAPTGKPPAMLDLGPVAAAEVHHDPFVFFTASPLLSDAALAVVRADFPKIDKPGIYPLSALECSGAFARLIDDIRSEALAELVGEKLGVELRGLPLMITVRGHAQKKDGRIHTDTKDKVATCLLYLNERWDDAGGRLRMLRSGTDLEDYAAEVSPSGGTLAAFKVAGNSWHGHKPFVGERRYVMFNWVRSEAALNHQLGRHKFSAAIKRLVPFFYRGK